MKMMKYVQNLNTYKKYEKVKTRTHSNMKAIYNIQLCIDDEQRSENEGRSRYLKYSHFQRVGKFS